MRLEVTLPLPGAVASQTEIPVVPGAIVRDPAVGEIGEVVHARMNWRDGEPELVVVVEIDDRAAVAAATRDSPVF